MQISAILAFLEAEHIPFLFSGNLDTEVSAFSSLSRYKQNSLTWIKAQEYIPEGFDVSQITLAIASETVCGTFQNVIHTAQSKYAFFSVIERFFGSEQKPVPIGQFTYISPQVKLGKNVSIGHNCTLDGDITIGDNTVIWNHVTIINRVIIGQNCEIQSGTVIGHDGFGYTEDASHRKKMIKHFGGVWIGNDVHLGMNNVIARGVIDDTVIGNGTKLSDLCHIGHNNVIGNDCTIINSALYGSCRIGQNAYISYSVVKNQTQIGNNAFIGMNSNVIRDIPAGVTVIGNPARPLVKGGNKL